MDGSYRKSVTRLGKAAALLGALAWVFPGCGSSPIPYGRENTVSLGLDRPQVWALAPAINMSGQAGVDPLLQADRCFKQLQEIKGLVVIPVNRVVEVYAALGLERVQNIEQAAIVCDLLGADGLLVPTVTYWEPYNPPKMGGALQLFPKPGNFVRRADVDPRDLVRQVAPETGSGGTSVPAGGVYQAVGMFDAADGSVRESILKYTHGRADPISPYGTREIFYNSDLYATFVYRRLTEMLLDQIFQRIPSLADGKGTSEQDRKKAGILEGGPAGPQAFPSNRR